MRTAVDRRAIAEEIIRRVDTVSLCRVDEVRDIHARAQAGEFDNWWDIPMIDNWSIDLEAFKRAARSAVPLEQRSALEEYFRTQGLAVRWDEDGSMWTRLWPDQFMGLRYAKLLMQPTDDRRRERLWFVWHAGVRYAVIESSEWDALSRVESGGLAVRRPA